jgi:hypothetical protein
MPFNEYVKVSQAPAARVSVDASTSTNASTVTPAPVDITPVVPSAAANHTLVASAASGAALWQKPDRSNYVRLTGTTLAASSGASGPRCIGW